MSEGLEPLLEVETVRAGGAWARPGRGGLWYRCRDKFLPAVKFFPPPVTLPSILSAVCIVQN